jgi:hypothetical protein
LNKREKFVGDIINRLRSTVHHHYQAFWLGMDVFKYVNQYDLWQEEEGLQLINLYSSFLKNNNLEDVVSHQANYAIKLAQTSRLIEYEEMHKLFSIVDELMALKSLGFEIQESLFEEVSRSQRDRFQKEPGKSSLVAEDKVENWNRDFWWYKLLLAN